MDAAKVIFPEQAEVAQLVLKPGRSGTLELYTSCGKLIAGQVSVFIDNQPHAIPLVKATIVLHAEQGVILEGHKNG